MVLKSVPLVPGLVDLKKEPGSFGCTTRRPTLGSLPSIMKNEIRNINQGRINNRIGIDEEWSKN